MVSDSVMVSVPVMLSVPVRLSLADMFSVLVRNLVVNNLASIE